VPERSPFIAMSREIDADMLDVRQLNYANGVCSSQPHAIDVVSDP
jgi:hypothetical protein